VISKADLKQLFPELSERALDFLSHELSVLDAPGPVARSAVGDRITNALSFSVLIEHVRAIKKFDAASTRLATRIYWLTWALVALTIAMLLVMLVQLCKGN